MWTVVRGAIDSALQRYPTTMDEDLAALGWAPVSSSSAPAATAAGHRKGAAAGSAAKRGRWASISSGKPVSTAAAASASAAATPALTGLMRSACIVALREKEVLTLVRALIDEELGDS